MEKIKLISLDNLFLPKNIQKSLTKAIKILDEIDGKGIEEKLENISLKYKDLEINGIKDRKGYEEIKAAATNLQKIRTAIKKVGEKWRSSLTAESKKELKREKKLLIIFAETEEKLKERRAFIDNEKEKEKRWGFLPMRKDMLKNIEVEKDDDFLLSFNEKEFSDYYDTLKKVFETNKQDERLKEEREKEINERIETERKNAVEEERKNKELEERRKKELEKAKKEELKKNKKIKDFLIKNNFQEGVDIYKNIGSRVELWRKIDEIFI